MTTETTEPTAPLSDIDVGFTTAQARAIVMELDALWANSAHDGKKKVHELFRLRATLAAAVEERETNP